MRSWVLAACLLAAAVAPPALAADMDDGTLHPEGGLYDDDPRYDEDDDDDHGGPPTGYDDDDAEGPPTKYSDATPPYNGKCVRSEEVRERLTGVGWHDFHAGKQVSGTVVSLRARRPNGQLFELSLHRCSGQIVDARALEAPQFGPYAYKGPGGPYGPWRRRPNEYDRPGFERPYADRWPRRWFRD